MSTLTGTGRHGFLNSENDLASYFQSFAKPTQCRMVGLEAEFFPVDRRTGKTLPYEGPEGIHEILKAMAAMFGYEPLRDGANIIALKRGSQIISLEPGGQMELSAPPVQNVFDIDSQVKSFTAELHSLAGRFPHAAWLAAGFQPFSRLDEISWVPKTRYRLMAEYMKSRGTQSHEMMKRTCTNQVSVDYSDEENAMTNLRVVFSITSIVSALFANSSISEGKPSGFLARRIDIWNHTDPARSGILRRFLEPGARFRDYVDYLLDMPMMFIVRGEKWIPAGGITFRAFLKKGLGGEKATIEDFELHLSTAFPEARLKQFLEIRGMDCQKPDLIPALAAFWKGILYDAETACQALKEVSFAGAGDILKLHQEVPRKGLKAQLAGRPIFPIARDLVELSCSSLAKQKTRPGLMSECVFLERIREEIIRPGKSPAETLLEKWEGEFGRDPARLIEYLAL